MRKAFNRELRMPRMSAGPRVRRTQSVPGRILEAREVPGLEPCDHLDRSCPLGLQGKPGIGAADIGEQQWTRQRLTHQGLDHGRFTQPCLVVRC